MNKKNLKSRSVFNNIEDKLLIYLYSLYGNDWEIISQHFPNRNSRQCKDRYQTYLNPNILIGNWSKEEDELIINKYLELGNKWVKISKFFPNRTDTAIKNRFNHLKNNILFKNPFDKIIQNEFIDLFNVNNNNIFNDLI